MPDSPFTWEDCRFLFNELNFYPSSGGTQFVELMKYCTVPPPRTLPIIMQKFKILFIDHDGYLVGQCPLEGTARHTVGEFLFYTIGGNNVVNKDMPISSCQFASNGQSKQTAIPTADVTPIGIALVHHTDPKELSRMELSKDEKGMEAKKLLTADDHVWIMAHLQDLYVYTSSSPYIGCSVFQLYYSEYEASKRRILRDWKGENDVLDTSLSRCSTADPASEGIISSPFQPELFFVAPKSPGSPNRCSEATHFVLEDMLPQRKKPRLASSLKSTATCSVITETLPVIMKGIIAEPYEYKTKQDQAARETMDCRRKVAIPVPAQYGKLPGKTEYELRGAGVPAATQTREADGFEFRRNEAFKEDCSKMEKSDFIVDLQKMETTKTLTPPLNSVDILNAQTCFWFDWIPNMKKFRCKICHKAIEDKILPERRTSDLFTLLMTDVQGITVDAQGVFAKSKNRKLIENHNENPLHTIAVEYALLQREGYTGIDLVNALEAEGSALRRHTNATEKLFAAAYAATILRLPFYKFKTYHSALTYLGVDQGSHYANPDGHKLITMSISNTLHDDFCTRLLRDKPELSILLDTSSDVSSQASLAILFQTYDEDQVLKLYLYRILDVSEGETTAQLFKKFEDALKEDNLYNYVAENVVGYASDGAKNVKNFKTQLNKMAKREVVGVHCQAHRIQLAMKHAWEKYDFLSYLESRVNELHTTFNSRSPKKKEVLRNVIKEEGKTKRKPELKRIQSIRWVNSKLRALKPVIRHWSSILTALQRVSMDKSFKKDQRDKAINLRGALMSGTFVATLAFEIDVAQKLSSLSLHLQEKGNTLIGKKEKRIVMLDGIRQLKVTYGETLLEVLASAELVSNGRRPSLREFEESPVLYMKQPISNDTESEFYLCNRLEGYVDSLIEQVDVYFPSDASDNFEIFDAKKWDSSAPVNFGHKEISDANQRLKWGYKKEDLCNEWTRLRKSLQNHKDFLAYKNQKPEEFWTHFLKDSDVEWTTKTKQIIKDILTIPPGTAEVERVYSHYTAIKTERRWSLDVSTVEALVRIEVNGPKSLDKFDALHYAKRFLKDHSRADDTSRRDTWSKGGKQASADDNVSGQSLSLSEIFGDDGIQEEDFEELAFDDEGNLL